tara:strand:- start:1315 stop:1701 length:387 start_codon:yes stop_codon:yes gene_type:complete
MSHYAKVVNYIVTQVIVAEQDWVDALDGEWVQTSYNTYGGIHYAPNSHTPDGGIALRKNFAGISYTENGITYDGYTYDSERDAFYAPQPYPSWTLNEDSCLWEPPTLMPDNNKEYTWDEDTTSWVEIA